LALARRDTAFDTQRPAHLRPGQRPTWNPCTPGVPASDRGRTRGEPCPSLLWGRPQSCSPARRPVDWGRLLDPRVWLEASFAERLSRLSLISGGHSKPGVRGGRAPPRLCRRNRPVIVLMYEAVFSAGVHPLVREQLADVVPCHCRGKVGQDDRLFVHARTIKRGDQLRRPGGPVLRVGRACPLPQIRHQPTTPAEPPALLSTPSQVPLSVARASAFSCRFSRTRGLY